MWSGPRWLESFFGAYGDPVEGVALGHQTLDGNRAVLVDTFPRERPSPPDDFLWWPDIQAVASAMTNVLMSFNLPDRSVRRPPGFLTALAHRGEQLGAEVQA